MRRRRRAARRASSRSGPSTTAAMLSTRGRRHRGGRHRRRSARAGGRQGAARLRARGRCRARWPGSDERAARRGRRRRCCARRREARDHVHPRPGPRVMGDDKVRGDGRRPSAAGMRHGGGRGRYPAEHRSRRASGSPSNGRSSSTTSCARWTTRRCTRSASACSTTARSTAWSRRCGSRRRCSPTGHRRRRGRRLPRVQDRDEAQGDRRRPRDDGRQGPAADPTRRSSFTEPPRDVYKTLIIRDGKLIGAPCSATLARSPT